MNSCVPTISHCTISNNTADAGDGGGVYLGQSGVSTINNCVISGNTGSKGGGIYIYRNHATITNSVISGNTARSNDSNGGGIYSNAFELSITNCTISNNNSNISGGGIFSMDPDLTITNSIFWQDSPDEIAPFSADYLVTYSDIQGGHVGVGNIDANPIFVGNSDYHLTESSPCIDKGTSVGAPSYDIDGDQRPLGAGYDMGADEYPAAKIIPKTMPWIPLLLLDE